MKLSKPNRPVLKSLRGASIAGTKVRFREKKIADVRADYKWQADAELSRLDATEPMNIPFSFYLLDYAAEMHRPRSNRHPMAIETLEGRHIGNFTLYDIDETKGEAQVGIMIGERDYWDRGYGTDALNAIADYIFRSTSLTRLYLKTLDWNVRAQKSFAAAGFAPYGEMQRNGHRFLLMELTRDNWESRRREAGFTGSDADRL